MLVLTLVFVLIAASAIIASAQDSLCVGKEWGMRSAFHREECISLLNIPIALSSAAVVVLLVWSAWGKQVHVL